MTGRFSPVHLKKTVNEHFLNTILEEGFASREDIRELTLYHDWTVRAPLRAAMFRSRSRPTCTAILHPSAKTPGMWQCTTFDDRGPWGDVERADPNKALKDGLEGWAPWKLETVVAGDGMVYGKKP